MSSRKHRRYLKLAMRAVRLLASQTPVSELVTKSYDNIASGYDTAWTTHMRDLSVRMLDLLAPPRNARGLDLTCGTGFVTSELAARTGRKAVGVDGSSGMLDVARRQHSDCEFHHSDVVDFLSDCEPESFDVVTCAWGLGYSRPLRVVAGISRVLKPGGLVGIIDNSLFSLAGILWTSAQVFAENPSVLARAMNFRFLPGSRYLAIIFRCCGLGVRRRWDGSRTYHVPDGQAAIAKLTATGAAAGFEYAAAPEQRDAVFLRFAEAIEQKYMTDEGIPVTHRYLAVTGNKQC